MHKILRFISSLSAKIVELPRPGNVGGKNIGHSGGSGAVFSGGFTLFGFDFRIWEVPQKLGAAGADSQRDGCGVGQAHRLGLLLPGRHTADTGGQRQAAQPQRKPLGLFLAGQRRFGGPGVSIAGQVERFRRTAAAGDARRIAEEAGGAYDTVVAVGGDGTLNEVISGLQTLAHPPVVGYLPQGSTNDFAASLKIPSDPAKAAEAIVCGQIRQLDIGCFGKRVFVYVASFGAFTRTSYAASQDMKNTLGHFGYLVEGIRDLNTLRPYSVRITADGETLDGDYLFGAVANSTSIAGMMKLDGEEVVLDDGRFELLLIPNPKNVVELQNLIWALLNQQYDTGGLIFRHVTNIHVETDEELPWSLDGEYEPSLPSVDITNHQRALTMLL